MDALPYYKWHWQDWRANRRVQRMPWQAKGPYRELLDEFWAEGSLPTDMGELADIVGCTLQELEDLWVHIGPCWEERDGRLYNAKMDKQRTSTDAARVAMATGGSAGGKVSNSSTRAKGREANLKPTLVVPQSMPDIEEKTRLEKTRLEQTRLEQTITPQMVSRSVLEECVLSGKELIRVLDDVCKGEMKIGSNPGELRDAMVKAWREYDRDRDRIEFAKGAEKFFGEGVWKNRSSWKYKTGKAPLPEGEKPRSTLELKTKKEREYEERINAEARAAGYNV